MSVNIAENKSESKEQKGNSDNITSTFEHVQYNLPKPFHEYIDKKIWLASNENKKPISPITGRSDGWNKPEAWGTYSDLEAHLNVNLNHIPAIALSKECELIALDLDNAIDSKGSILPWAQEIIDRFSGTYIEKSSSGKGFHIFAKGSKPGSLKVKVYPEGGKLEVYDSDKVMRLTGMQYGPCDQFADLSPIIAEIYHTVFSDKEELSKTTYNKSPSFSDDEVIELARKFDKENKFKLLFDEGNISEYKEDASSADFALLGLLKYYTQDEEQLDRITRKSKLKRAKWDSERGDTTWLMYSIKNSLKTVKETYQSKKSSNNIQIQTENFPSRDLPINFWECEDTVKQPFPIEVFPDILKHAAKEIAQIVKVPIEMAGGTVISVTSTAVRNKVLVIEKIGLEHYIALFIVIVGDVSERKSTQFNLAAKPLVEHTTLLQERHQKEARKYRAVERIVKHQTGALLDTLKDQKSDSNAVEQCENAIAELEQRLEKYKPCPDKFYTTDTTEQALIRGLRDCEGCFSVITSEGSDVLDYIAGNKSVNNRTNESIFLKIITRDTVGRERIGANGKGESIYIPDPCGNVLIMVQPLVFKEFIGNVALRGKGLISRILVLPAHEHSLVGTRFEIDKSGKLEKDRAPDLTTFYSLITTFLNKTEKIRIGLDEEAAYERAKFHDEIEAQLSIGGDLHDVKDICGKFTTHATKLAALFHCIENPNIAHQKGISDSFITKTTFIRAKILAKYLMQQSINVQRAPEMDSYLKKAKDLLDWLIAKAKKGKYLQFKVSDIYMYRRPKLPSDQTQKLINVLLNTGWVVQVKDTTNLYELRNSP